MRGKCDCGVYVYVCVGGGGAEGGASCGVMRWCVVV